MGMVKVRKTQDDKVAKLLGKISRMHPMDFDRKFRMLVGASGRNASVAAK